MGHKFIANNTVSFTPPRSIYYKGTDIMEYCWNRLTYCDEVDINEILADAGNILIPQNMTIGRLMELVKSLRREDSIYIFTPPASEDRDGLPELVEGLRGENSIHVFTPPASEDRDGLTMDDIFGKETEDYDGMTMDDIFGKETEDYDGMTMDDIFGGDNTSEDYHGMTMDDIFGEDDYIDGEELTDDEGITIDNCCCDPSLEFDEFNSYISLADLNSFFNTLNFKPDEFARFESEMFDSDFDPEMSDSEEYDENDSPDRIFDTPEEYDDVMEELLNDYMS